MTLSLRDHQSESGPSKWLTSLNATDNRRTQRAVITALKFFDANLPGLAPKDALSYIRCMDLSREVSAVWLKVGTRLLAFKRPNQDPLRGHWYTRSGEAAQRLGINPAGTKAHGYRVRKAVHVLQSVAAAAKDFWSPLGPDQPFSLSLRDRDFGYIALGGALQYFIAAPRACLEWESGFGFGKSMGKKGHVIAKADKA